MVPVRGVPWRQVQQAAGAVGHLKLQGVRRQRVVAQRGFGQQVRRGLVHLVQHPAAGGG